MPNNIRSRELANINTHRAWENFKKALGHNPQLFWQYVSGTDHCPGNSTLNLTKEHHDRIDRLLEPNYYIILKIWHAKYDESP